jgi:prepilin peptidase CpaA
MQIAADVILATVLIVAAITDLRTGRIFNHLVYPAILLGLALAAADGEIVGDDAMAGLKDHVVGAAVAFALMFFCYAIGGMGGGDVKLMVAVGALGGFARAEQGQFLLYAIFYAFAIGAVMGLLIALWRGVLGTAAARTWWGVRMLAVPGTSLGEAVPKATIRVPFGFATCVGTLWLLAENYTDVTLGSLLG